MSPADRSCPDASTKSDACHDGVRRDITTIRLRILSHQPWLHMESLFDRLSPAPGRDDEVGWRSSGDAEVKGALDSVVQRFRLKVDRLTLPDRDRLSVAEL